MKGHIEIDREACKGCQLCIAFCPKALIALSVKANESGYVPASFNKHTDCSGCAVCALVCPEAAIEVYRG